MINLKCIYENGDYFLSSINTTLEEAQQYYVGNVFNIGQVNDFEMKCIAVEQI